MLHNFSKEEQLLWERKKCASWGITSYDLDPTSGRIIFPAGGSLFFCADPATGHTGPLFPYEIQVNATQSYQYIYTSYVFLSLDKNHWCSPKCHNVPPQPRADSLCK